MEKYIVFAVITSGLLEGQLLGHLFLCWQLLCLTRTDFQALKTSTSAIKQADVVEAVTASLCTRRTQFTATYECSL